VHVQRALVPDSLWMTPHLLKLLKLLLLLLLLLLEARVL
jgi:hypothetical protein